MTRAGHANMRTTQTYLHLAGVVFHDEAKRLEERLVPQTGTERPQTLLVSQTA